MNRMSWSRWIIKTVLPVLLVAAMIPAWGQSKARRPLLPHHLKLQFAGNTGFLSLGAGYENKKRNLEGDFFYGYVPQSIGGLSIHTLSSKLAWNTIGNIEGSDIEWRPLSLGILVSYTFGKQYFGFKPENFPYNYYRQPTSLHMGAFVGGQMNVKRRDSKKIRRIGLYYELVTLDTELLSYFKNTHALKLQDILSLGIGIRASFR
jgi:hypothetical protein